MVEKKKIKKKFIIIAVASFVVLTGGTIGAIAGFTDWFSKDEKREEDVSEIMENGFSPEKMHKMMQRRMAEMEKMDPFKNDPFFRDDPIWELHANVNRAFENFRRSFHENARPMFKKQFAIASPKMDILDKGDHFEITAELPGMEKEQIDVTLSDGYLTIKGEKKSASEEKKEGQYMQERSYGYFQRTIPIPQGADTNRAETTFDNGVLKVTLPKLEKSQEKEVKHLEIKDKKEESKETSNNI